MPTTEITSGALDTGTAAGWTGRPNFMLSLLRYNDVVH